MLKSGGRADLGRLCLYMLSLGFENPSEEAKILECLRFEACMNASDQAKEMVLLRRELIEQETIWGKKDTKPHGLR